MAPDESLRILHCFRSPVGGIFRHVRDLAEHHHHAGHQVGILCDSTTGGAHEDMLFATVRPHLALGLVRTPIRRAIGPADIPTIARCNSIIRRLQPDIIHGHGAKGGALARMIGARFRVSGSRVARLYTPHGGSLHYRKSYPMGRFYFLLERLFENRTNGLVFVSDYERQTYLEKVGTPTVPSFLIYNGLDEAEFEPVAPRADVADFVFIGMMRQLKGPDIFIEAFLLTERLVGRPLRAVMIGDGDDKPRYEQTIIERGLKNRVQLYPAMRVREAFGHGKVMIVPSRAESMPYIVLEAIAAGLPLIASNVGGIPEILGQNSEALVPPGDVDTLARTMQAAVTHPQALRSQMPTSDKLKAQFSAENMAREMIQTYRKCLSGLSKS